MNALLTYKEGLTEIASIMGYWREVKCGDGYSEGDCGRTLIVGMLTDGEFITYEGQHINRGGDNSPVAHALKGFVACTLSVRVMDLFSPNFVYEDESLVTKNPLSIVPKQSSRQAS